MRDQQYYLACHQFSKAHKGFVLCAGIKGRSGFIQNNHLGITDVSAGQGNLLPFASRKIDAAFKAAAQHLPVSGGKMRQ